MANDGRESAITTLPKKVPIDWFTPRKWNVEMSLLQEFHIQNNGIMIVLPSAELCRQDRWPEWIGLPFNEFMDQYGYMELVKYTLLTKKEMDSMRILVSNGYTSVDSEDGNDDGDYIDVEYEDDNNNNNNNGGGGGGNNNNNNSGGGRGKGKAITRKKVTVKAVLSRDGKVAKTITEGSKTAGPSKEKKTQTAGPLRGGTQMSEKVKGKWEGPPPPLCLTGARTKSKTCMWMLPLPKHPPTVDQSTSSTVPMKKKVLEVMTTCKWLKVWAILAVLLAAKRPPELQSSSNRMKT